MAKKRKPIDDSFSTQTSSKKWRHESERLEAETASESQSKSQSTILPALPQISDALSEMVFTHQSFAPNKSNRNQATSYERLEFVGDAYIELMATRLIWDKFNELPSGRLSQIRELLVKNDTLGEIAVRYGLDQRILVASDVKNNAQKWKKVKGDVVEAYVAAIVLNDEKIGGSGFEAAEKWLYELWAPKLEGLLTERAPNLNAKEVLSRKLISRGIRLEYLERQPVKRLAGGQQTYFVGAYLFGWGYDKELLGSGQGLSKTIAGNLAAEDAARNPLVESIAEKKRDFDQVTALTRSNKDSEMVKIEQQSITEEGRSREAVEKKRSVFMSSEFD